MRLSLGDVAVVDFNSGGSLLITESSIGTGRVSDTVTEVGDNTRLRILNGPVCGSSGNRWRWFVEVEDSGLQGWASEGVPGCPADLPECS